MSERTSPVAAERRAPGRALVEAVVVIAVTGGGVWGIWQVVDWSPVARQDPARSLLLGPRMAFGLLRQHGIATFGRAELVWFLAIGVVCAGFGVVGLCWGGLLYRPGWLAVLASWLWLLGGLRRSSVPVLFTAGGVLTNLYFVAAAWIVLGFPSGRLRRPEERWCVRGIGALATAGVACEWLFFDPRADAARHATVSTSTNLLFIGADPAVETVVQLSIGGSMFVLAGVLMALLVLRWRAESLTYRVSFAPVFAAAVGVTVAATWLVVATGLQDRSGSWGVGAGAVVLVAVIGAGLEIGRRRFGTALAGSIAVAMLGCVVLAGVVYFAVPALRVSAVRYFGPSALVVAIGGAHLYYCYLQRRQISLLRETTGAEGLEVAVHGLRGVTGDASIELWRWDATNSGYIGTDGRVRTPERSAETGLCELWGDGVRLGALIYEQRVLPAQPELFTSTQAIAASLLERERSVIELAESRRRIVAAGDEQRRRIERDIHDGAQNRITHVMYLIQFAQRADGEERNTLLRTATDHLSAALTELRDLTQGIYPAELIQGGLRPAFTSLAERSSIPVRISGADGRRLPVEIEAAGYFITAEAVTNANKHAAATGIAIQVQHADHRLRIVISDDGCGGADVAGAGLRGLRDRAEALGGRLTVHSPAGRGTELTATLPIDEQEFS